MRPKLEMLVWGHRGPRLLIELRLFMLDAGALKRRRRRSPLRELRI